MTDGFGNEESGAKIEIELNKEVVRRITKEYKNIKKYMKSSLYAVKKMDGTEDVVSKLLKEGEEDDG